MGFYFRIRLMRAVVSETLMVPSAVRSQAAVGKVAVPRMWLMSEVTSVTWSCPSEFTSPMMRRWLCS